MNRRLLSAATGVLVICALVTGCGSGGGSSSKELSIIMTNMPWQEAIEPHIKEFEEDTGIDVKVQTYSQEQMRDRLLLNMQSHSPELDVFMTLPSREGPQYSEAGYYEPLDGYLEDTDQTPASYQADGFGASTMEGMQMDDETVAIPVLVEATVAYYRKDLFDKYDIAVPKTLDELSDAAATIESKSNGSITGVTLRGLAEAIPYTFSPFLHGLGGTWTDENGDPNMESPEAIEAIDRYASLARDYGPTGVANYTFTQSSALFAQGKVGIEIESSNEVASLVDQENSKVADDVGVMNLPGQSAGSRPTVLSWGLGVSAFSENKDNAWKFVQWATSPQMQLELADDGIAPPRPDLTKKPAYQKAIDTPTLKEWNAALDYAQKNGDTEVSPVGVKTESMRRVIGIGIGKVILGEATASEAATEIQDELEPLMSDDDG